jgi:hypothetical protein
MCDAPTIVQIDGEKWDVLKLGAQPYATREFSKKYIEEQKIQWTDLTIVGRDIGLSTQQIKHSQRQAQLPRACRHHFRRCVALVRVMTIF